MQVRSEAHRHTDLLHLFHLQRGPTHTDGQVIDPALSLVSHHRGGVRKEGGRPVEISFVQSGVARFLRKKTIAANRTFNHRFSNAFRPGGCGS